MLILLCVCYVLTFVEVTSQKSNCTGIVCTWLTWGPWEACQVSGTQTQTNQACCPENLKPQTIENCVTQCDKIKPGQLHLKDAHRNRTCTPPTTTVTTKQKFTSKVKSSPLTPSTQSVTTTSVRARTRITTTSTGAPKTTASSAPTTKVKTNGPSKTSLYTPSTTRSALSSSFSLSTSNTTTRGKTKAKGQTTKGTNDDSESSAVPAAIGATLGVLALSALASCLAYFFWFRKKRSVEDEKPTNAEEESNGTPPVSHSI